jgi:surface antigen
MSANKIKALVLSASLISTIILPGCAQNYANPQEASQRACSSLGPRALSGALIGGLSGAALGAGLGAAAGNGRGAAIGAGAGLLAGLLVGMAKGHELDQNDCREAQVALQQLGTQPTGRPVAWSNTTTGNSGSFIPVSDTYTAPGGQLCRKISADYMMKDRAPVVGDSGVVCRDEHGDWARSS